MAGVVDVSREFDQVISLFFMQSFTGFLIGLYHLIAIFLVPILLKYEYPVGVFNKINLSFGAACMVFMHLVRYSHYGKVCSGDFLTQETLSQAASHDGEG